MTLDEAIKHAEEVAEEKSNLAKRIRNNMKSEIALSNADECESCAEEHKQLAEWLKDYKRLLDQKTNNDSVSRKAILSKIKEVCFSDKWLQFRVNKGSHGQRDFIIDYIEKLPPVTPERKKARWIKQYTAFVNDDNQIVTEYHCNNCYGISYFRSMNGKLVGAKYCPNCGTEMETKENYKEESGNNEKK